MERKALGAIAALAMTGSANAGLTTLDITFENVLPAGSFSLTPFWTAFHDGSFDTYDGGAPAAGFPGITELAEDGLTGPISTAFGASPAAAAGGVDFTTEGDESGAPVFSPGESRTTTVQLFNTQVNRYFSYASMVVPSNDLFIGNGNPLAHEVFDAAGNFTGPVVIEVFAREINDNGTEVNNAAAGAAFSALGGEGIDESNNVTNFFDNDGASEYLLSFVGTTTADGNTVTSTFSEDNLVARITIVPAPGAFGVAGLGVIAAIRRRR